MCLRTIETYVAQLPTLFDDEGVRFFFFFFSSEWLLHKRSEKCSVRRQRGADGRETIIRGRQAGTSQQTASNNNVCVVTHVTIGEKSNGHFSYMIPHDSHTVDQDSLISLKISQLKATHTHTQQTSLSKRGRPIFVFFFFV